MSLRNLIVDGNGLEKSWDVSDATGTVATVFESRANAELLAAAPELLEALRVAKRLIESAEHKRSIIPEMALIRDALNKAMMAD